MKIFEKYLVKQFIRNTLVVIFVFVALFSIFNLLEEFNEIGSGDYTFASALTFIIFKIPKVISEVFVYSILISALSTIGLLLENRELIVIQNGFVSSRDIALKMVKFGFIISMVFLIISESTSPFFNEFSESYKASKTGKNYEIYKESNIWIKKNSKFIHIDQNNNNKDLEGILIIDLTDKEQLTLSKSNRGKIINSNIEQIDAEIYRFEKRDKLYDLNKKIDQSFLTKIGVNIDLFKLNPREMNLYDLFKKIYKNEQLGLNSNEYQIELFSRITKPIHTFILLMIAIPLIFDFSRNQNLSKNIFLGILIGLIFNLIMKFNHVANMKESYEIYLFYLFPFVFLFIIALTIFNKRLDRI